MHRSRLAFSLILATALAFTLARAGHCQVEIFLGLGEVGDWAGFDPLGLDPFGDSMGENDLRVVLVQECAGKVCFRIDAALEIAPIPRVGSIAARIPPESLCTSTSSRTDRRSLRDACQGFRGSNVR